jgi:mRNA interferase HigB
MKVVGRDKLDAFAKRHTDSRHWIEMWLAESERTVWRTPQEIKERFASASFLAENLVIFNVRGNNYRLEVRVAFKTGTVVVQWIGTHDEYTKRHARR